MVNSQYFKNTAYMLWMSYVQFLIGNADASDIKRWLDLSDAALQCANQMLNFQCLYTAVKLKLQAAIALIKNILRRFRSHSINQRNEKVGEGIATPTDDITSVKWDNINSTFENRIKTGVITNHKHLDIQSFLNVAYGLYISQINESYEKHDTIKVNTVLATEYVIVKNDEVGEYRGSAHNNCNINYQDSRTVPVVFYNFSDYDAHVFINEIATRFKGRVQLLTQTKEKNISFTKFVEGTEINLRFIDSLKFMPTSLHKLSSYLEKFNTLEQVFARDDGYTIEQINLLKRKGVDAVNISSKDDLFSSLHQAHITDDDYKHAINVWQSLNIKSLGQYSDLYLKYDFLLLTEVFENFRNNCLTAYGLNPAYYYTTPRLTWDAMLKYIQVELDLLTDIDMLMFIERDIRDGISQCCNHYAKINNPYMKEGYHAHEDEKYFMYFDIINLYVWAMIAPLHYGGFKWVYNVEKVNFFSISDNHPQGYILEVDLEYPEAIRDKHKDKSFCAEHMAFPGSKQKKLMTAFSKVKR